jgi:hypothetical protein
VIASKNRRGVRRRPSRARSSETPSLRARALPAATRGALVACLAALSAAAGAPAAAPPVTAPPVTAPPADFAALLDSGDYEAARPRLLEALPPGDGRCLFLGGFAAERSARVREHAVRLMADAGCDTIAAYRPFLADASPWVTDAVMGAVERHLIGAAIPWLLERLEDPRQILDGERTRTIGAAAHRALRVVSCQSFHYRPEDPPAARAAARRLFAAWYETARAAPRDAWVREGIARARDYLERPGPAWRREGLALLALIGAPAAADLRAALRRSPEDLHAGVVCRSDDPPRVGDALDCVLVVQNAARRRIALAAAPGPPRVTLAPLPLPGAPASTATRGRAGGAAPAAGAARPAPDAAPAAPAAEPGAALEEALVDLGPGEILERAFKAGPVGAAGRYEVRATLADPAAALAAAPPIEGRTVVRFEQ